MARGFAPVGAGIHSSQPHASLARVGDLTDSHEWFHLIPCPSHPSPPSRINAVSILEASPLTVLLNRLAETVEEGMLSL
jgi:hypothetical protein